MFDNKITLEKFFYDNLKGFDMFVWTHRIFNGFLQERNEAVATYNSLISLYKDFKKGFQKKQGEKVATYHPLICDKTETEDWKIHIGRVLYIYWGKIGKHRIGIECAFKEETYKQPLGKFHISVASWDKATFEPYTKKLEDTFPNRPIDYTSIRNRAFLSVAALTPDENQDVIISIVADTYNKLKKIIKEHEDA